MKNKWMRLLLLTPLVIIVPIVNFYVDPANVFHNISEEVAKSILNGNATYVTSGNLKERDVKAYLIKRMPKNLDCVAIGPSLIMGVRKENVYTNSFFNLGHSAANYYDILAQFGLLEEYNVKPKRIILCVDSYFFCDKDIYPSFYYYAERFLTKIGEYDAFSHKNNKDLLCVKYNLLKKLFSVQYVQASKEYLRKKNVLNVQRWGIVTDGYNGAYYLSDGSWVYAKEYQRKGVEYVINNSKTYNLNKVFAKGKMPGEKEKTVFEKSILFFKKQGIEIVLFLCPVAPALWERLDEETKPGLLELEKFAQEMAQKFNVRLIGTYDTKALGIKNEEYLDARHIRHEKLQKYFDFKRKLS